MVRNAQLSQQLNTHTHQENQQRQEVEGLLAEKDSTILDQLNTIQYLNNRLAQLEQQVNIIVCTLSKNIITAYIKACQTVLSWSMILYGKLALMIKLVPLVFFGLCNYFTFNMFITFYCFL